MGSIKRVSRDIARKWVVTEVSWGGEYGQEKVWMGWCQEREVGNAEGSRAEAGYSGEGKERERKTGTSRKQMKSVACLVLSLLSMCKVFGK